MFFIDPVESVMSDEKVLAPQRFGEADEVVGDLFDSLCDFFVSNVFAIESVARGKSEPWNNDAAKVEHEAIGIRHDRHVTRVASSSANEADNFVFPCASGELDHVLSCSRNIVIVNRRGNEDPICVFNSRAQFSRTRHTITLVGIAEWEVHFADVDPIAINFLLLQMRKSDASHPAAVAVGITASADDKMLGH